MKIIKCLKQKYQFQDNQLFDEFRGMINEAIRVGIESGITSKLSLRNLLYEKFRNEYNAYLISMAVFKAHSILRNYRKALKRQPTAKPYVKKKFIIIDSTNVKLCGDCIRFSVKPKQFITIPLNRYILSKLSQPTNKIGNLIIREKDIIIPYSYSVQEKISTGHIGIDMNFRNIVTYDGEKEEIYDLSKVMDYKEKVREHLSHIKRNDYRIQKKLKQKYGEKQRNKETNLLHNIANKIVSKCKTPVMEKLKYIGRHGRKGNGRGNRFRFRLHSWSRYKVQHIIDYKSKNNGRSSIITNPRGTSSKCSACGAKMKPEENRMMRCSACCIVLDRDINAARNIYKRGLWFGPIAQQGEGMIQSKDVNQIAVNSDLSQPLTSR